MSPFINLPITFLLVTENNSYKMSYLWVSYEHININTDKFYTTPGVFHVPDNLGFSGSIFNVSYTSYIYL